MDPLSQGVVGATASQSLSNRKDIVTATALGFFSGMAADLDIFIRSSEDPLLFLEFHRQFTHSIIFMPIGGLICAVVFWAILHYAFNKTSLTFAKIYLFSTAGYATHGFLDACTSYGTQLFWPFSSTRVAWNNVSIIDPIFTLSLLSLIVCAVAKRSVRISYFAAFFTVSYLSIGVIQEHRATNVAQRLADSRGHDAINLNLKPSFANLIIWKSIYEHQGRYYVDAIRVTQTTSIFEGDSIPKLDIERDLPWLNKMSQQADDIERFRWFSSDHLALDPNDPHRIIDMRYSMLPNELDGLWGIKLSPYANSAEHIKWIANRNVQDRTENIRKLWSMIKGLEAKPAP
jgi:inner membrane protein